MERMPMLGGARRYFGSRSWDLQVPDLLAVGILDDDASPVSGRSPNPFRPGLSCRWLGGARRGGNLANHARRGSKPWPRGRCCSRSVGRGDHQSARNDGALGSDNGAAVAPAIVWRDRRTAERCEALQAAGLEPQVMAETGLCLDPYFSGTKVAWILDRDPALRARAETGALAFGTIDSWLIYRLTGGAVHATDATNASDPALEHPRGRLVPGLCEALAIPKYSPGGPRQCRLLRRSGAGPPRRRRTDLRGGGGSAGGPLRASLPSPGGCKEHLRYGLLRHEPLWRGGAPLPASALTTVAVQLGGVRQYALEGIFLCGRCGLVFCAIDSGNPSRWETAEVLARTRGTQGGVYLIPAFVSRRPALGS